MNEKIYSVWYDGGDEANSYYLTREQAEELQKELKAEGYETTIINMHPIIKHRRLKTI